MTPKIELRRLSQHPLLSGTAELAGGNHPDSHHPLFPFLCELMDDTPDMYVHYFISSQIYFEHTAFFLQ